MREYPVVQQKGRVSCFHFVKQTKVTPPADGNGTKWSPSPFPSWHPSKSVRPSSPTSQRCDASGLPPSPGRVSGPPVVEHLLVCGMGTVWVRPPPALHRPLRLVPKPSSTSRISVTVKTRAALALGLNATVRTRQGREIHRYMLRDLPLGYVFGVASNVFLNPRRVT